jgi:hypothetical protein
MPASDEHLTRRLPTSDEYLAQRLTPYPLPTKDSGLLRTVGDARTYLLNVAEGPQATRPLAAHQSATLARSRCGGVDPAGSPSAVHGRQARRCAPSHEQFSAMATAYPCVMTRRNLRQSRFWRTYAG